MSSMLRSSKNLLNLCCKSRLLSNHVRSTFKCAYVLSRVRHKPIFTLPTSSFTTSHLLVNKSEEAYLDRSDTSQHSENDRGDVLNLEIQKLNNYILQKLRISQTEFEKILTLAKSVGKISAPQGFLLLCCCGANIPEMQREKRGELVENVWKTLHDLRCPLDISHYNALLKVYLENEHKFNPVEFLSTMEQQGFEPNQVTYHRLVSLYCQDGDIEGASKILEIMKVKQIPINEDTFGELIKGHAHADNMEDAKKIIDVMRNSQLIPSSSTYASLACGYARMGDLNSIEQTIQEASSQDLHFGKRDILNIIYTLTINNHGHLVEEILPHLWQKHGLLNDFVNISLELINRGYHEVPYSLLNTMPRSTTPDGTVAPSGFFFIRQIVKENLPFEVIMDYCNKMVDNGLNAKAIFIALQWALEFSNADLATAIIKEMHSKGYELRPHYFWPILISRKGNDEGLYDVLKLMLDLNCPVELSTFEDYVLPHLSTNDPSTLISHMKDIGYDLQDIVEVAVRFSLQNNNIKAGVELLEEHPIRFQNLPLIITRLVSAFLETQDISPTIQILQYCNEFFIKKSEDDWNVYEKFLTKLVNFQNFNPNILVPLVDALKEKNVKISRSSAKAVSEKLWIHEKENILECLVAPDNSSVTRSSLSEPVLQTKGIMEMKGNHSLLIEYARNKDVEHSEEVMKELNKINYVYGAATYNLLIEMYCYHGDLDKALHFKNQVDTQFPDFRLFDHTIVNLANLMVSKNKFDDAINLIINNHSRFGAAQEPKLLFRNVFRFLNSYASSSEPKRIKQAFETLVASGYCAPKSIPLLGLLIKTHFMRNDTASAVEEFLRIVQTYRFVPVLYDMFMHLVRLADSNNLQKIVDASVQIQEESHVLHTLARVFIDCGHLKQAKKVLETPGLRLKPEMVYFTCENYVAKNMVNELEMFLQASKSVFGLDRERMYCYLLQGYINAENVEKALGIWVKLQEENLFPSNITLHLLGAFLQRMNQPVPFDMPTEVENNFQRETNERSRLNRRVAGHGFRSGPNIRSTIDVLIEQNKLDEAVKVMDKLLDEGKPLNFVSINLAKRLSRKLCDSGDTDSLLHLQEKLPEEISKKLRLRDIIPISSIANGKAEELLTSLETEVFKYKGMFPGGALLHLLNKDASHLKRVENLVDIYYEHGDFIPRNVLWTFLMSQKMFEKANQLYECTPEIQSNFRLKNLLFDIRVNKDIELSHKLLDLVTKSSLSDSSKGRMYSCHIDLLRSMMKIEEASNFVIELQKTFSLQHLQPIVLLRLKKDLKNANLTVPSSILGMTELAVSAANPSTTSSLNSSSDSSDSD